MLPTRDSHQGQWHIEAECEGMEKISHANRNDKKLEVSILISEKTDFKTKAITKDKEGHYIMIKRSIRRGYYTH